MGAPLRRPPFEFLGYFCLIATLTVDYFRSFRSIAGFKFIRTLISVIGMGLRAHAASFPKFHRVSLSKTPVVAAIRTYGRKRNVLIAVQTELCWVTLKALLH